MDFDFTDEQVMLRDTVAAYLADHYDFDRRRQALRGDGWRPHVWSALANELGLFAASFPEDMGGFGGGAIETMIVMEEFGRALVLEPYLPTVVIGGGFLKHGGNPARDEHVAGIIDGTRRFAFAQAEADGRYNLAAVTTRARRDGGGWVLDGRKSAVVGAPFATHLIVTARTGGGDRDEAGISVFLVEAGAPGISRRDFRGADGLRASDIGLDGVRVPAEALVGTVDDGLRLVERVVADAIAATCGEACGVLHRLLDGTVDYCRQRIQFGKPLGSFQVLQHRMVDMFVLVEQAVSMTYMVNMLVDDDAERAGAVAAAKVQVGKACKAVGEGAIQLHGGIGLTDEMAISHYFKRAVTLQGAFGSVDHHLAAFQRLRAAPVADRVAEGVGAVLAAR